MLSDKLGSQTDNLFCVCVAVYLGVCLSVSLFICSVGLFVCLFECTRQCGCRHVCVCVYLCTASVRDLVLAGKIRRETGPPSEGLLAILSTDRVLVKEGTKSAFKCFSFKWEAYCTVYFFNLKINCFFLFLRRHNT